MKDLLSPKDIVSSGLCIGCGSCVAQSHAERTDTGMHFDAYGQLKPYGPSDWYEQPSEAFTTTCPFSPAARNEDELSLINFPNVEQCNPGIGRFQQGWVGHVQEDNFRMQGSSGGMVSWVASELMRKQLIDGLVHVVATEEPQTEGKYFRYRISRTEEEIKQGAKSRYYPVELSEVLEIIREVPGRYAVVAVPCMIKAIHLLRQQDPLYHERIRFTLGLFCGHMKSATFVESFAWQMNVPVNNVNQVDFRHKYPDRPANLYNAMLKLNDGQIQNRDWWHLADGDWGAGFFMNSACNFCDDVVAETADISFGDAWVEPYSSDGKGTNVVVIRSLIIQDLVAEGLSQGRLKLEEVSGEFVEQTQAAGLRHRREGLAYRLTWSRNGVQPRTRVQPDADRPAKDRKLIYRTRYLISKWSHRMFWLARKIKMPSLYMFWARTAAAIYHGIAYHQGKISEMKKRFTQLKR
jgi:coenzyme F420-reducing hydrogenase beta subunit